MYKNMDIFIHISGYMDVVPYISGNTYIYLDTDTYLDIFIY